MTRSDGTQENGTSIDVEHLDTGLAYDPQCGSRDLVHVHRGITLHGLRRMIRAYIAARDDANPGLWPHFRTVWDEEARQAEGPPAD